MKTREEAVRFMKDQLEDVKSKDKHITYQHKFSGCNEHIEAHHYGKCDLYDLMDFIYGERK